MTYLSTCLADGAIGLWILGEASDASAADDATDISDGVYTNTTGTTPGQTGISGGAGATAVRFTAANNGYVAIPFAAGNLVADVVTLECWVKRASTGSIQVMICPDQGGGADLRFSAADTVQIVKMGVALIATSTSTITDTTTFHHVVWTKNGATNVIYIDGVDVTGAVTNATLTTLSGVHSWLIGSEASPPTNTMDGTMQFVAIYPTALSGATVLNHYTLGAPAAVQNSGFLLLMRQ